MKFSVATSFLQEMKTTKLGSNFQWAAPASPGSARNRPRGHLPPTIAAADSASTCLNFCRKRNEPLCLEFEDPIPWDASTTHTPYWPRGTGRCTSCLCRHRGGTPAPVVCMPFWHPIGMRWGRRWGLVSNRLGPSKLLPKRVHLGGHISPGGSQSPYWVTPLFPPSVFHFVFLNFVCLEL